MTEPEIHLTSEMARARRILLDTAACPSCGSPIATTTCGTCWIDLSGDAGAQIWQASLDAVAAIEARAVLAARVRVAAVPHARVAVTPPPVPAGFPADSGSRAPRPAPAPVTFAPAVPPRWTAPAPVGPPRPPLRVQSVLQILGVALLAVASLVFLVFSWDVMDVGQRGLVIAVGTVGVLVLAPVLERRELEGSAQAVGVLGAVLVVLDAWAVYAIGLAPGPDPGVYAAVACLACAALLGAYGSRTGIRAGTVTATLLAPLAPLMLLGHVRSVAEAAALLLGVTVIATLRFVPQMRRLDRSAERGVLDVAAVFGVTLAWIVAVVAIVTTVGDGDVWSGIAVLLVGAVLNLAQAVLAARAAHAADRRPVAGWFWAVGFGIFGVTAAAAVSVVLGLDAVVLPVVLAVAGVLAVSRWPRGRPGRTLAAQATDAATLTTLVIGLSTLAQLAALGGSAITHPGEATWDEAASVLGGSAALVVLLTVVARWRRGPARRVARHVAAPLAGVLAIVAGAVAGGESANATLLGVSLASGVAGLLRLGWLRRYLRATATLGLVAALLASAGQPWWLGGVLAASTALAYSARWWGGTETSRAVSTFATAVLGWAALAQLLTAGEVAEPLAVAAALAVAILTVVALWVASGALDRHTALAVGGVVGAVTWAVSATSAPAVAGPAVVLGFTVSLAVLGVAVRGRGRLTTTVLVAATAAVAPSTALALATANQLAGRPDAVATCLLVVTIGGIAAVAAGSLPAALVRRAPLELSGWGVVVAGVLASGAHSASTAALAFVLAALVAAACSVRPDRRVELWVALGMLVAASWCALTVQDVGVPEAYLAPLGVTLAIVGGFRWWRGGPQAAVLLGSGLALATVPTAVIADPLRLGSTSLDRTVLATVASAVLVLTSLVVVRRRSTPHTTGVDPVLALAAVGGLLALLGPARQAVVLARESWTEPQPPIELWALPAAALLAGACVGWLLARPGRDAVVRRGAPWVVMVVATLPGLLAHDDGALGIVRICVAAALGTYLGARGVAGLAALPGERVARWSPLPADFLGLGAMLLVAGTVAALNRDSPVPADAVVLVVFGLPALLVGGVRMRAFPQTPTWTALGPGLAGALAAPTLVTLIASDGWRVGWVLAGGIVAVWAGAARRWQAPFLVGSSALVVEVVLQLAPVTRQAIGGLGWWVVLAVGGAALLGLGLTYERRLRDAKEAVRYVSEMS